MLNCVTQDEGFPAAVLIRALQVEEGQALVAERRSSVRPADWTSGPARLCKAFAITGALNGADLTDPASPLFITVGEAVPEAQVRRGPRVGIPNVPEPWRTLPWRFRVQTD